ncbi:MAG: hypothetical protein Q7K39_04370 [Candidatus Magasanikbacteria bacterium]|nr:hypothetical protein [Candidatus Magasanikbacteria bacterium]
MPPEPTILVKKKDGTTERVPLSSVLKNLKPAPEPSAAVPAVVKPAALQAVSVNLPARQASAPAVSRPPLIKPVKPKDRPIPVKINNASSDWHTSLLEEDAPISKADDLVAVSAPRVDQVDKVITSLSFTVPADFVNRLRSLAQLRLKDVRTTAQTKDAAMRPLLQGGLALAEPEANELEAACAALLAPSNLEAQIKRQPPAEPGIPVLVNKPSAPAPSALFKISKGPLAKVPMNDVVSRDVEVSPIDEIRLFNLIDLRRLGSAPAEAASRLRQKFLNLREESILFYLDSLTAWRESPLFSDYIKFLASAAQNNKSLATAAANTAGGITPEEVLAIAHLNQELNS